jgi:hypothetical protein
MAVLLPLDFHKEKPGGATIAPSRAVPKGRYAITAGR